MHTKRTVLVVLLVGLVVLVSACGLEQAPITSESEGIWNHFFVFPMSWMIIQTASFFQGSYGIAIIIMTIFIRLLLLPLFLKQQKSNRAMQKLRPELDELRKKYDMKKPEEQQKMQQEMMKIYQKSGVNPLAGCLPVLIQMPILMAFYFAIVRTEQIATHSFLWMNLGLPDPFLIMPILAGAGMFIQMQMSTKNMPTEMASQMKIMLYIMPVLIIGAGIALPSALSLYWFTGSLFMILQTWFIQRNEAKEESHQPAVN